MNFVVIFFLQNRENVFSLRNCLNSCFEITQDVTLRLPDKWFLCYFRHILFLQISWGHTLDGSLLCLFTRLGFNNFRFVSSAEWNPAELILWFITHYPSSVHYLSTSHIFLFFSKTAGWIIFKLDWDVPWVDFYQVCSLGGATIIFWFCYNYYIVIIFKENLQKNLLFQNSLTNFF